jgi:hypothetical protein
MLRSGEQKGGAKRRYKETEHRGGAKRRYGKSVADEALQERQCRIEILRQSRDETLYNSDFRFPNSQLFSPLSHYLSHPLG